MPITPGARHWRPASVFLGALLLAACGGGGGNDATTTTGSNSAVNPSQPKGVFTGYDASVDNIGADGGGDGGGGFGIGGSLGRVRGATVIVTLRDGSELGRAPVDDSGTATIRPGSDYDGPLLIELRGGGAAAYFDEAVQADQPFGEPDSLRLALPKPAAGLVAITPLTNGAVRYLEKLSGAGSMLDDLARIDTANRRMRDEINRFLPTALRLDDIVAPAVLVDATTPANSLGDATADKHARVLAAIAEGARAFDPGLARPAAAFSGSLANDMTDGTIDDRDADGRPIAGPAGLGYGSERLADDLRTGARRADTRYATPEVSTAGHGDGSTGDGASGNGSTGDGSTGNGSSNNGSTGDGSSGDGSSGDGSSGGGAPAGNAVPTIAVCPSTYDGGGEVSPPLQLRDLTTFSTGVHHQCNYPSALDEPDATATYYGPLIDREGYEADELAYCGQSSPAVAVQDGSSQRGPLFVYYSTERQVWVYTADADSEAYSLEVLRRLVAAGVGEPCPAGSGDGGSDGDSGSSGGTGDLSDAPGNAVPSLKVCPATYDRGGEISPANLREITARGSTYQCRYDGADGVNVNGPSISASPYSSSELARCGQPGEDVEVPTNAGYSVAYSTRRQVRVFNTVPSGYAVAREMLLRAVAEGVGERCPQ